MRAPYRNRNLVAQFLDLLLMIRFQRWWNKQHDLDSIVLGEIVQRGQPLLRHCHQHGWIVDMRTMIGNLAGQLAEIRHQKDKHVLSWRMKPLSANQLLQWANKYVLAVVLSSLVSRTTNGKSLALICRRAKDSPRVNLEASWSVARLSTITLG